MIAVSMGRVAERASPRRSQEVEGLVQRYGRLIRSVVARVLRRHASLGDDVEQRVVVALWRKLDEGQTIEKPERYIYRCALREAVRTLKREQARGGEPLDDQLAGAAAAPDQALRDKQLAQQVAGCVAELGEDRRRAVSAHLAGFSVEEIMAMHGWSYQKARNLVARGMADLRARLHLQGVDGD